MTSATIITHAKSAALTFAATMAVEVYAAVQHAEYWSDIVWAPLLSAVTLTAARTALKALITAKATDERS